MAAAEATLRPVDDNPSPTTRARREVARLLVVHPELKAQGWQVEWPTAPFNYFVAQAYTEEGTGVILRDNKAVLWLDGQRVAEVLPREGETIYDLMMGAAEALGRYYGVKLGSSPNPSSD